MMAEMEMIIAFVAGLLLGALLNSSYEEQQRRKRRSQDERLFARRAIAEARQGGHHLGAARADRDSPWLTVSTCQADECEAQAIWTHIEQGVDWEGRKYLATFHRPCPWQEPRP